MNIIDLLNTLKKELLDLTLSNQLIKIREFKAKGLSIKTDTVKLFNSLTNSDNISFSSDLDKTDKKNSIKTSYNSYELEKRLNNTFKESRVYIEERGVNTLFVSLGALKWIDFSSKTEVLSPLLLVPVDMQRKLSNGKSFFTLRYDDGNIETNETLVRKIKLDFNLNLPLFNYENLSISDYYENIRLFCSKSDDFELVEDHSYVGNFSFQKIMMFRDLDDINWLENTSPSNSKLLQNLLHPSGNISTLEQNNNNDDIQLILDADDSQSRAIYTAINKNFLVIKGPPGTGKSQTIVNIISSCIKNNKTVLFVAEKMAALDVVKRRLDNADLEDVYLELHSHKANTKDVLKSLTNTLRKVENGASYYLENTENNNFLLSNSFQKLDSYYSTLFKPCIEGLSLTVYDVLGKIVNIRYKYPDILTLVSPNNNLSDITLLKLKDEINSLCSFVKTHGLPKKNSLYGIKRISFSFNELEVLKDEITSLSSGLRNILLMYNAISSILKIESPKSILDLYSLDVRVNWLLNNPGVECINIHVNRSLFSINKIDNLFNIGKLYHKIKSENSDLFIGDVYYKSYYDELDILERYKNKIIRHFSIKYHNTIKTVKSILKIDVKDIDYVISLLKIVNQLYELRKELLKLKPFACQIFSEKENWDFENIEWLDRLKGLNYLDSLFSEIDKGNINSDILNQLSMPKTQFRHHIDNNKPLFLDIELQLYSLISKLEISNELKKEMFNENSYIINICDKIDFIKQNLDKIDVICLWNRIENRLIDLNSDYFIKFILNTEITDSDYIYNVWEHSVSLGLLSKVYELDSSLFISDLDYILSSFSNSDFNIINNINRKEIKIKHLNSLPVSTISGSQMPIIKREMSKMRRIMPLRNFIKQTAQMLQRIKPVFMMSPLSISTYLEPDSIKFDYIIFDEASQIKPIEGFGALLRGDKIILVGDNKQLPPTDFFNKTTELDDGEYNEDDNSVNDLESILDLFLSKNAPESVLKWHYRSKHESLINISNKVFYDQSLIVAPSALHRTDYLGFSLKKYNDTYYTNQRNEREAYYIVEELIRYSKIYPDPSKRSIGIVTFSISQKNCIEDILWEYRKKDFNFNEYISAAENTIEPFFIKNLENVQGDERDDIFISIGYGKDVNGRLMKRFGPVNKKGGERRLNVLFSRSRYSCTVFSNFDSSDLSISSSDSEGVKVLSNFLNYAEFNNVKSSTDAIELDRTSFVNFIKLKLEEQGFTVHTHIGTQNLFIDLAIIDPNKKDKYLLGIECDYSRYSNNKAARDRYRIRQNVLTGLGWNIYRVWSSYWFKYPQVELEKLLDYIDKLQNNSINEGVINNNVNESVIKETFKQSWKIDYKCAYFDLSNLDNKDFSKNSVQDIADAIKDCLKYESPMHKDFIKNYFTHKLEISRIGSRINDKFNKAFELGAELDYWEVKDDFIWLPNQIISMSRNRKNLANQKLNKLEWVAPEELWFAMKNIILDSISISYIDLLKETNNCLTGGIRISDVSRSYIEKIFQQYTQVNNLLDDSIISKKIIK